MVETSTNSSENDLLYSYMCSIGHYIDLELGNWQCKVWLVFSPTDSDLCVIHNLLLYLNSSVVRSECGCCFKSGCHTASNFHLTVSALTSSHSLHLSLWWVTCFVSDGFMRCEGGRLLTSDSPHLCPDHFEWASLCLAIYNSKLSFKRRVYLYSVLCLL